MAQQYCAEQLAWYTDPSEVIPCTPACSMKSLAGSPEPFVSVSAM